MLITLLCLIYLGWQTYKGYQIGFTRKIVNLILSAVFFSLAIILQNPIGNFLYSQYSGQSATMAANSNELIFARFLAFFIIYFIFKRVKKLFGKWLPNKKADASFSAVLDGTLGALASLIAAYFFVYVCLSMLNALQIPWFIEQSNSSAFIHFVIYQTPILSNGVFNNLFSIGKTAG
ncbi:CvpA family protein [Lactobacillus psittaci]|uniref:CvpA family protein n=1 Tax=Lactobacillus psittaci DSM 15354 TaxID=1122152 RepID=A0A0R1S2M6_9LACO|nr:CvpA family protein [Lactobacillus psittaci]KRL63335.1 hypothetical protein FC23_GL000905 [Lactobacillus psittaci DSM 15354]